MARSTTGAARTARAGLALALAAAIALLATACEPPAPWTKVKITGFTPVSTVKLNTLKADQGPATVHPLSGAPYQVYGGELIGTAFTGVGWNHVGDPDSLAGYIVWPYQAADSSKGKMFNVVTPHGRQFRYTHALDPGEAANNSFAAISPDGQWLVSGEWGAEERLLVYPMPMLNPSVPSGDRPLASAGQIDLSATLDGVQGCDFVTSTRLVCSVDDSIKRLVAVDLAAPLSGTDVAGTVTQLGKLPTFSTKCKPSSDGGYETEGVDFDPPTKLLRVEVIPPPPCYGQTDQYTYLQTP